MRLDFRNGDDDLSVDVQREGDGWLLRVGEAELPLSALAEPGGAWLVDTPQGRRRLWVVARGDERLVFCDGHVHTLRLVEPGAEESEAGATAGPNLVADMPGKVVAVKVAEGDAVAEGQVLVIMESMKMETELVAAVPGTVARIHVADGQVVGQGDALVDIAPDGQENA